MLASAIFPAFQTDHRDCRLRLLAGAAGRHQCLIVLGGESTRHLRADENGSSYLFLKIGLSCHVDQLRGRTLGPASAFAPVLARRALSRFSTPVRARSGCEVRLARY